MQTNTYRPNTRAILGVLALAALFLGGGAFVLVGGIVVSSGELAAMEPVYVLLSLLLFALGFYFAYACIVAWATVAIDDDGISIHGLSGKKRLLWRDIDYAEILGNSDDNFVLQDRQNHRMEVDASTVIGGAELKSILACRIEPVLDKVMLQWRENGATLRARPPFQGIALIAMAIITAICLYGARAALNMARSTPSDAFNSIGGTVLGCLGALLFGWCTLYVFTMRLRLTTNEIRLQSLISNKRIAFGDIAAVSTRDTSTEGGPLRTVTVRDRRGKTIMLSASYPNSALLVRIIREAAGKSVLEEGAQEIKRQASSATRTQAKFLIWASPLYLGILLAPGLIMINQGRSRIDVFNRIRAEGIPAHGAITGKEVRGSKSTEYVVDYSFTPDGSPVGPLPIKGASPVSYDNWNNAEIGQQVDLVYIPSEPQLCHLTISIADRQGVATRIRGIFYLLLGIVGTALYVGALYKSRRKAAGTWKDPEPPVGTVHHAAPERYALQRELRMIAIGRILGYKISIWSMGVVLGLCLILLLASSFVPDIHDAMSSHHGPLWLRLLIGIPACITVAGMLIVAPLGEWYAFARTRSIEQSLPDPELTPMLALALYRSRTNDRDLSGATSLRLLNAITTILAHDAEAARFLASRERGFLYGLLAKWSNRDDRQQYCLAAIHAISAWNDTSQAANLRTISKTCNVRAVRDAALASLESISR